MWSWPVTYRGWPTNRSHSDDIFLSNNKCNNIHWVPSFLSSCCHLCLFTGCLSKDPAEGFRLVLPSVHVCCHVFQVAFVKVLHRCLTCRCIFQLLRSIAAFPCSARKQGCLGAKWFSQPLLACSAPISR